MSKKTSVFDPEDFARALVEACNEYTGEVRDKVEAGLTRIGYEATQEVKSLSPVYSGTDRISKSRKRYHTKNKPKEDYAKYLPGAYKKRWVYTVEKTRGKIMVTVHNKQWSLTHLLENGHLNRDGTTRSKAIPHISTANADAESKIDKLLEDL